LVPGGSYFDSPAGSPPISPEQQSWDVVDSFAVSVTLMLAVIGFTREFRRVVTRSELLDQVDELERRASERLTAAMVGLLRSFAVNVFPMDDEMGHRLMRTVNQGNRAPEQIAERLHESLKDVIAGLRDSLTISTGTAKAENLENPYWLFECGWSWGVVRGASEIETNARIGRQSEGIAENAPYLYFTTVAMDAADALASERTRLPGWLDAEQLRLAQQLQVRSELVRSYWATVATFDSGSPVWPIEDLPWRTTDGQETDYYSLLVAGLVMPELSGDGASGAGLRRIGDVLDRLAERSRITARVTGERATGVEMHHPGVDFPLVGSATPTGPELVWTFADVAPVLLKRTLELAARVSDGGQRRTAVELAEKVWEHLERRRIRSGTGEGLWDRAAGVFPGAGEESGSLSWYYTKRIVDCMITAGQMIGARRKPTELLSQIATDMLDEAEHLHDGELLNSSAKTGTTLREELDRMGVELRLAREMLATQPSITVAITGPVLHRLGVHAAARRTRS
jgi:hypothetical protein